MSWLESSYTKAVKRIDRDLFCKKGSDGSLAIFRTKKRFIPVQVSDDLTIYNLIPCSELIFKLTHNWSSRGEPRMWGIDQVLDRLREIDTVTNENLLENIDRQNELVDESQARHFRGEAEAFFSDQRSQYKKIWGDTLTHSLSMDEPRKRLKDRSIKCQS